MTGFLNMKPAGEGGRTLLNRLKIFGDDLAVVEMMFHTFDFLIVFMTLAGYEHYVAFSGEH